MSDDARLAASLAGIRAADQALLADLAGLTDAQARQASALPGWSVGHDLTHIARNGDSVVRRLDGAARGEVLDQYVGGVAGRAADIEAGSSRSAAELVADVANAADGVQAAIERYPATAWDALSKGTKDGLGMSRQVVFARWREVAVHHADLGLGPVALPPALVEAWLPEELAGLAQRTDPAALLAWILGRGPAPQLESW
jgi:maleylpyruvate isomerase